ncbi:MAG: baseplate J/gp47 family protein [Prolixibacteraceae bacterium]|jgi:uncharacterized phage protein gp47/JayE|nr:baseplate J/gp47 family protein [Prolixibacteraceae bacterium]
MAILIPRYNELYNSLISDFKNKFEIQSVIGKSVIVAMAAVLAGKQKLMYTALATVNQNIYPDLADEETLRRFGRIRLGRDLNPPTAGGYIVLVSGTVGAEMPAGSTFSDSNGYLFVVDSTFTLAGSSGEITLRALTPGQESALAIGTQLQLTSPLTDVDSFAEVSELSVSPTDGETIDEYRENVIDSFRLLPQGGSRSDYRTWLEGEPGVREVYPHAKTDSVGEVDLYVEAFVVDSTDDHGTPPSSILDAVEAEIEPDKIPIGTTVNYLPVEPTPIDVYLTNLDDEEKITQINTNLEAFLYEKRPFIAGADIVSEQNKGKLYSSEIFQIVADAGVSFDAISCEVDSVVFTMTEFTNGTIPYINEVYSI